ncbi:MAG TPA: hypothetical protein VEF35_08755 [Candidatus Bathyarchaeia archaeon]|nr:hypothetical protein [Candidatus Bathyarchaeia archaeon]
MKVEKLRELFKAVLSEMKKELQSYAWLFCAERGYCIDDSLLFVDNAGILPAIRVALTPALRYEVPQLAHLAGELENDLTNIVFDYAYNTRHKIGAEDLNTIEHIPYVSEHVWRLMTAPQN